jgi:hypothetical protein
MFVGKKYTPTFNKSLLPKQVPSKVERNLLGVRKATSFTNNPKPVSFPVTPAPPLAPDHSEDEISHFKASSSIKQLNTISSSDQRQMQSLSLSFADYEGSNRNILMVRDFEV